MVLNLRNPQADALARQLAELDGVKLTDAVIIALEEAIDARRKRESVSDTVDRILKKHGIVLTEAMQRPVDRSVWDELHESSDDQY